MARKMFEQAIFIAAPLRTVQNHLTQLMTDITNLHPFVIWTHHIHTARTADGTKIDCYLIRDRMKLGVFTLAFTYKVEVCIMASGKLVSNAYQSPGIHLHNQTWCEPEDGGTRVKESIEITAPQPLMKITYQGAAQAHREMLIKLKEKIEREQLRQ